MEKFKPPNWCSLKYGTIAEAVLGAADMVGANIYHTTALTFTLLEFDIVEAYMKKVGKNVFTQQVVEIAKKGVGNVG